MGQTGGRPAFYNGRGTTINFEKCRKELRNFAGLWWWDKEICGDASGLAFFNGDAFLFQNNTGRDLIIEYNETRDPTPARAHVPNKITFCGIKHLYDPCVLNVFECDGKKLKTIHVESRSKYKMHANNTLTAGKYSNQNFTIW